MPWQLRVPVFALGPSVSFMPADSMNVSVIPSGLCERNFVPSYTGYGKAWKASTGVATLLVSACRSRPSALSQSDIAEQHCALRFLPVDSVGVGVALCTDLTERLSAAKLAGLDFG